MEFAMPNPNMLVSKFTKACRLRSIGVFPSENPDNVSDQTIAISTPTHGSAADDKTQDHIAVESTSRNVSHDSQLPKLFDMVSSLKLAYVQLQLAHLPYDPDKIVSADELVVSMLEDLSKFRPSFKDKNFANGQCRSSQSGLLGSQTEDNERTLDNLKSRFEAKDKETLHLQQQLKDLEIMNTKLLENIRQKSLEIKNATFLNITAFRDAFESASNSIHDFAKPLISLMKASGWDLDEAANAIQDSVSYSKRSHKKYAFEAYIARRMFHGMPHESYNVGDVMMFEDPIDALMENPNSAFAEFCRSKYLLVVHPDMEASFFGNLDQRVFVSGGKHPRTPLYQVFLKMAKWVWVLRGIGSSIEPKAESFTVNRGSEFSQVYMESVEEETGSAVLSDEVRKVEFMVMPGFRMGETLVRSRVYLSSS